MNNRSIIKQKFLIILLIWFSFSFFIFNVNECGVIKVLDGENDQVPNKELKEDDISVNLHLNSISSSLDITAYSLPEQDLLLQGSLISGLGIIIDFIIIIQKSRQNEKDRELTRTEEKVLSIIHDYLSENRYFEMENVKNLIAGRFSNSENSLNGNGIENTIQSLLSKNHIVIGSKYIREEILDNENRSMIYSAIVQHPGIHFMKLVNLLGLSIFLVKWHLSMLKKFNFINKTNYENREIFFDYSVSETTAKRKHFLSRKKTVKIMNFLSLNKEGLPKYKISNGVGIHYNTATKYLEELIEFGIVGIRKQKNATYYLLL